MSNHNHKSAFAVRCHTFGKAEKRLYDFAKEYFGKENTFLVLNTEEALDIPSAFNKIIFNSKKIKKVTQKMLDFFMKKFQKKCRI